MLCVSIPKDLTIARAKTVFMVTAQSALVSICNMFYVSLRYFNVKLSDNCFIVKALGVLSFTNTDLNSTYAKYYITKRVRLQTIK